MEKKKDSVIFVAANSKHIERVMKVAKARGQKVVVVDPKKKR